MFMTEPLVKVANRPMDAAYISDAVDYYAQILPPALSKDLTPEAKEYLGLAHVGRMVLTSLLVLGESAAQNIITGVNPTTAISSIILADEESLGSSPEIKDEQTALLLERVLLLGKEKGVLTYVVEV